MLFRSIFRAGERFTAIYAVKLGFFKTEVLSEDGRHQVTSFYMPGEVLGMDGISAEAHHCDAIALEDSEVSLIPFHELETISVKVPTMQRHLHRVMSREIVRDQGMMMMLGAMRAEERVNTMEVEIDFGPEPAIAVGLQRLKRHGREGAVRRHRDEECGRAFHRDLERVSVDRPDAERREVLGRAVV